jgi:hypothetical protein
MNVPRGLFYVLWAFICTVAFQVSSLRRHETSGFPLARNAEVAGIGHVARAEDKDNVVDPAGDAGSEDGEISKNSEN